MKEFGVWKDNEKGYFELRVDWSMFPVAVEYMDNIENQRLVNMPEEVPGLGENLQFLIDKNMYPTMGDYIDYLRNRKVVIVPEEDRRPIFEPVLVEYHKYYRINYYFLPNFGVAFGISVLNNPADIVYIETTNWKDLLDIKEKEVKQAELFRLGSNITLDGVHCFKDERGQTLAIDKHGNIKHVSEEYFKMYYIPYGS